MEVKGSRMLRFHKRVQHCREKVPEWRNKETTNSRTKIENIKGQMENMQREGGHGRWDTWDQLKC